MKKTIKNILENLSLIGRKNFYEKGANSQTDAAIAQLKKRGFIMLDHMVGSPEFKKIKASIDQKIERDFELNFPCLSQAKLDHERDQDLIARNFLANSQELKARGVTFDREDVTSYHQMVEEFVPSTLTVPMPSEEAFYQLWLDPVVMSIVSGYIGFDPHLTEAYVRRNFPSEFKIMNFNWHRDTNHDKYLVKAFMFFTDCDINTGAHHYIAGSIHDERFRDKVYFTDEEINDAWPMDSEDHIVSTVPAGTIIIEDTRGLHKAGIPKTAYRDLGYAIFTPPNIFRSSPALYKINKSTYENMSPHQQNFIPSANIHAG